MMLVVLFGFEKILDGTRFGGEENQAVRHIRLKEHSPLQDKLLSPSDDKIALSDTLEDKPYSFKTRSEWIHLSIYSTSASR